MFELRTFQSRCANLISARFAFFVSHPDRPYKSKTKPRPFFQALSALTGAGKTPILAQAVGEMRGHVVGEPIVFWISKAKAVIGQTQTNFSPGGKYRSLVDEFRVSTIAQLTPKLIADSTVPLIVVATTGLFNSKDQSDGALNIYKTDNDKFGDSSPWQRLIDRADGQRRRPLFVVYDEAHNLSEQQTEILAELEPDAYLVASATLKFPEAFRAAVMQPIVEWFKYAKPAEALGKLFPNEDGAKVGPEHFLTTAASAIEVVDAELVKKAIQFDGSTAAMQNCVDELFARKALIEGEAAKYGVPLKPKAIYVCKTNIGDDGEKDDPSLPFKQRSAPPIRIWRYLVEQKKVDPADIAIYANLAFADGTKPNDVRLFSKKDEDYAEFQAGSFRHIIFNLALQEGWDDPECYLAYVDKSMGSSVQVEQLIGRVLRQFDAKHYDSELLNSSHFFLRVDKEQIFSDAIRAVKDRLREEGSPIQVTDSFSKKGAVAEFIQPKAGERPQLLHVHVDSEAAQEAIAELIESFPAIAEGDDNSIATARSATETVSLKSSDGEPLEPEWVKGGHTNSVRLRWLLSNAIKSRSKAAFAVTDASGKKFDVRVQVQSKADSLAEEWAKKIAAEYYQGSELVYEAANPFEFGALRVAPANTKFQNGIYDRYSGFNSFEAECAKAIDQLGQPWHRNSSGGGFRIPLLSEGDTAFFYPDFLVWNKGMVFCLDTKGSHILSDAVARKLFDIRDDSKVRLAVRFITEGKQTKLLEKPLKGGFTVWKLKSGAPTPIHVASMKKAVDECIR